MQTVNPRARIARSHAEYVRLRRADLRGPVLIEFAVGARAPAAAPRARGADPDTLRRRVAVPAAPSRPDPLAALEAEVDALERRVRGREPAPLPPGWEPTRSER